MQILTGRATGKTTKLLRWLAAHPGRVLVVHSAATAHQLKASIDDPKVGRRIVYIEGFRPEAWRNHEVALDEAGLCLEALFRLPVAAISVGEGVIE